MTGVMGGSARPGRATGERGASEGSEGEYRETSKVYLVILAPRVVEKTLMRSSASTDVRVALAGCTKRPEGEPDRRRSQHG